MATERASPEQIGYASENLGDFNVRQPKGGFPAIWRFANAADAIMFKLRFDDAQSMTGV